MARLNPRPTLTRWVWNVGQYGRRLTRSFGTWEWSLFVIVVLALLSMAGAAHWRAKIAALETEVLHKRFSELSKLPKLAVASSVEAKQRLQEFEKILIPHEYIPQSLSDLLQLAADEGLLVQSASYRAEEDSVGGFMRYHTQMPIKGSTQAIQRFLLAAVKAHRNLILASVRLKRDTPESDELEANVQWVWLTQLPSSSSIDVQEKP